MRASLRISTHLMIPLMALLPALAQAGGAFLVKGGTMRLSDDRQMLDLANRDLEENSNGTIAFNIEARKRNGVALGFEYINYRHDFTSPVGESGEARTQTAQFLGKKYFIQGGPVHPYLGVGIGAGKTNVDYTGGGGAFTDQEFTLALQALLGMELRFDNLSFLAEVKHMYHDIEGGGNEYDPTATGLFVGMGFNW